MSDLVGNPEDRFSHNEAHLLYYFCGFLEVHRNAGFTFKISKIINLLFVNSVSCFFRCDVYFSLFLCGDYDPIYYSIPCLIYIFQFVLDTTACP